MVKVLPKYMKMLRSKKSEVVLATIFIVLIIIIFLGWLVNVGSRECRTNSDCDNANYCGSDFACHQIPTIEKTIVQNNFIVPSIIIAIAIIIAAIVLKWKRIPFRNRSKKETEQEQSQNPLKMP